MTFQLDTSGVVTGPIIFGWLEITALAWSDLSPFTQGYVEAAAQGPIYLVDEWGAAVLKLNTHGKPAFAFHMLAPETLARIIEDCEAAGPAEPRAYAADTLRRMGAELFRKTNLTVQLGDDGKVRFA